MTRWPRRLTSRRRLRFASLIRAGNDDFRSAIWRSKEQCHADRQSRRRSSSGDFRLAAGHPRPSGAAVRRAPHRGRRGGEAQELRLRRGGDRHRPHRRGRRHPRQEGRRQPHHRASRRHGCAADRGGHRPVLQVAEPRQDARLRPRRPHRHAARRREISRRDAQLRRHRGGDLPAGRGGRRRRPRDGQRRHDGPLQDRGGVRDAQLSRLPDRRFRHPVRPDDGGGRPHLYRHRRPRRPRGAAAHLDRYRRGGRGDRQRAAVDRVAQRRSAGIGGGLDHPVPRRHRRQHHSADRASARHGAKPDARDARSGREARPRGGGGHRQALRRQGHADLQARLSGDRATTSGRRRSRRRWRRRWSARIGSTPPCRR